ncbi:hypothetical protein CFOL_v3_29261 [Cephalotus follicularis]|uniref:Uncharacterized protein n=1 Tax=Cephalotus follicularis TaxID=3775 RepID=A0A1Q3D016_CEPFO|nr:hypothetical protein CFOL_v3_29261 [Cephalotus follicularis]
MDSTAHSRMSSKRRPLHTCGVTILAIVHSAYTKALDFNGPVGSMTRKIARLAAPASPLVYALQYQWLRILSLTDDNILAFERIIETLCPPSNHVFNKIDDIVQITETLPGKFDDVVNKLPMIVHKVPLLDWALVHLISLTHWGSHNANEKEIMIDTNCSGCENDTTSIDQAQNQVEFPTHFSIDIEGTFPPIPETRSESEAVDVPVNEDMTKGSDKEVLEKGMKEDNEKGQDNAKDETQKCDVNYNQIVEGEKMVSKSDEGIVKDDPLLELFELGWLMKPEKRVKKSFKSRSVSYN